MPTPPPAYENVAQPPSEDIPVSYREFAGLRGCNGQTHILQSDGAANPGIAIQATGNIYLDASARMQQSSDVCVQSVGNRLLQYITDIEKHVSGQVYEHIEGPSDFKVNTDHTVEVVGNHTLNVATAQETVIGGGGQTIDIAGNLTTTVVGNVTETVQSGRSLTVTGKNTVKVLSDVSWFKGGHFAGISASADEQLKISNSLGINIGAKEEANIAISETLNVGGSFEQTFALKRVFNAAICNETTVGVKMGINKAVDLTKTSAMSKSECAVRDSAATFMKADSKLWKLGSKLCMFS